MQETILSIKQVSEMLHLTENTLRWMRHVGTGPKSFKIGRRIAYLESDIAAYITAQVAKEDERLAVIKDATR